MPISKLSVVGGTRPASIDPGNYAADLKRNDPTLAAGLAMPRARNRMSGLIRM
ncbi:MAG: hypothetical protein LBP22_13155 [Deltaproteobacteria bacterium]|jgi:hypothetical protein|nr:hypothetical protein [Deltaproteobacteria bacterium]